jgi:hypothetical protein
MERELRCVIADLKSECTELRTRADQLREIANQFASGVILANTAGELRRIANEITAQSQVTASDLIKKDRSNETL